MKRLSIQLCNTTVLLMLVINSCHTTRSNPGEVQTAMNSVNLIAKYQCDHSKKYIFFHKSNSFVERSCHCMMEMSCSCCEAVLMPFIKVTKRLCANFIYKIDSLKVDISLDAIRLKTMTVMNYRPFIMCTSIPGSLFSFVCLNVLELNQFPRSITACTQLNIKTMTQDWKLNYRCISISTILPIIVNETMASEDIVTPTASLPKITQTSQIPSAVVVTLNGKMHRNSSTSPVNATSGHQMQLNATTPFDNN